MARYSSILSLFVVLLSTLMMGVTDGLAQTVDLIAAFDIDYFLCNGEDTLVLYQSICNVAADLGNVTLPQAPVEEPSKDQGTEEEEQDSFNDVGPAARRRKLVRGA